VSAAAWLRPVAEALDDAPATVTVFIRDDDGGWHDARLAALLDVIAAHDMAVDVALIPTETTAPLVRDLALRARGMRLGLHQHGWSHADHETEERRCEFGPARPLAALDADVARGRSRLLGMLGDMLDPVFTPPWNRCVPELAPILVSCGIRVLSRDLSAGALDHPGLAEVPVGVDWFGGRRGVRWTPDELGERIAQAIRAGDPLGLMLHHAVTDPADLARIDELLALLGGHARVRPASIMDVARARAAGAVA
jgi:peptidoglycan/xylan/chitin deacetylase (PgdA/CDA1 family)